MLVAHAKKCKAESVVAAGCKRSSRTYSSTMLCSVFDSVLSIPKVKPYPLLTSRRTLLTKTISTDVDTFRAQANLSTAAFPIVAAAPLLVICATA